MKHAFLSFALSLVCLTALAQTQAKKVYLSPVTPNCELMCEAMSPSMEYQVGVNMFTYAPVRWNIITNEVIDYIDAEEGAFHAVNDMGIAVGDDGLDFEGLMPGDGFAIISKPDGTVERLYYNPERTLVRVPDPVTGDGEIEMWQGEMGSNAYCISADGRTIGGFYFMTGYQTFPCIWRDGERITLPLPDASTFGFEADGAEVRWMTPDASLLVGFLTDNYSTWPACIWRLQEDGSYKAEAISAQFYCEEKSQGKPYMLFQPTNVSQNGEWISVMVHEAYDGWNVPEQRAARLNLKTMEVQLCAPMEGYDQYTTAVANDGTVTLITLPYMQEPGMIERVGYIWKGDSEKAVRVETFTQDEKVDGCGDINAMGSYSLSLGAISADGRAYQGFGFDMSTTIMSFLIDLDYATEGITPLTTVNSPLSPAYDLQGRAASTASKGIYLQAGQKTIR